MQFGENNLETFVLLLSPRRGQSRACCVELKPLLPVRTEDGHSGTQKRQHMEGATRTQRTRAVPH